MAEEFDSAVRDVSGEPLLGLRQAAFVDAITERLRDGEPLSTADLNAVRYMLRVLGLVEIEG